MREFLMLAKTYKNTGIAGHFISEKYDGMRAFWDGGITRGIDVNQVPWANMDALGRAKVSTGLWSRYGHPIFAPSWWLDKLPPQPLDGELWIGRGRFQETMSICKQYNPGPGWQMIQYLIIDRVPWSALCSDGTINNPNFKKQISWETCERFLKGATIIPAAPFESSYEMLKRIPNIQLIHQERLPFNTAEALFRTFMMLDKITDAGGEGLMIRKHTSYWSPERSSSLLKLKKFQDDEGVVVGYTAGMGKYAGMVGSFLISWKGKRFSLSGFTDQERELIPLDADWARQNPGVEMKGRCLAFPIGTKVTFRYREVSNDGIPKEARYWRTTPPVP